MLLWIILLYKYILLLDHVQGISQQIGHYKQMAEHCSAMSLL